MYIRIIANPKTDPEIHGATCVHDQTVLDMGKNNGLTNPMDMGKGAGESEHEQSYGQDSI